jgi:hypothetical protein
MTPKSHHYNPKVYLRQFRSPASKNELWEYDLRIGTSRQSTPKLSGCEDFYHSFTRADGTRDDETIENSFHALENDLPKLFEEIRSGRRLSDKCFATFVTFAALQRARSPVALHSIQEGMSKVYQMSFEIMQTTPDFEKSMVEKGQDPEAIRKLNLQVKAERDSILLTMLSVFQDGELPRLLSEMEWTFLQAPPSSYFFTSDNPVCCWPPPGAKGIYRHVGPSSPDVEITFPLSRRVCALGIWKPRFPNEFFQINQRQVEAINYRTIVSGWHFLYGPSNDNNILQAVKDLAAKRSGSPDEEL